MSFIRAFVLFIMASVLLAACGSKPQITAPVQQNLMWPSPPAKARVGYVRAFSQPEDLGIEKGFFKLLGEFIMGTEETKMIRPMSIVVTKNKTIYVADPGVQGIHRFDMISGDYAIIRQKDNRPLFSPVALTRGSEEEIYVVDSELAKIFRLDADAEYFQEVTLHAELKQPTGMAIGANNGRFYIIDTLQHQLKIFNANGTLYKTIGQRGSGNAEFNFPTHIWLDSKGLLYITDSLNFRIQVLDTGGNFIRKFGHLGDGTGNMSRPKGVTTDNQGRVFVVDALFHALQIFNEEGKLLLPIGQRGQAPGEFWLPTGIFLGDNGDIYIADSHNRRVQVFRYLGEAS